jgi:hypothetical protein
MKQAIKEFEKSNHDHKAHIKQLLDPGPQESQILGMILEAGITFTQICENLSTTTNLNRNLMPF